jgi:general secretion pathway protein G
LNFALCTLRFCRRQTGFTLIELLVVVAIVAFLMTLFFPNFMAARQRARDSQRKSDLAQMQRALELYKSDQNPPVYPTNAVANYFDINLCNNCWSSGADCSGNIYMRKVPCDPGNTVPTPYLYSLDTDVLKYTMSACLENPVDPDKDETTIEACTGTASYTVHEP